VDEDLMNGGMLTARTGKYYIDRDDSEDLPNFWIGIR